MKIYIGYGYTAWTTGVYLENALGHFGDVVYVGTPKDVAPQSFLEPDIHSLIPKASGEDLFFYIESGVKYFPKNIEALSCRTACYLIDVHVDLESRIEMARFFDLVFIAQKDYVHFFKARGIHNVWWLPLGCDADLYKPMAALPFSPDPDKYDIGFVGHVPKDVPRRRRLLSLLAQRYRLNDYAKFYSPLETAQIYGRSKIVFNCSVKGDLNMRVFEGMSCGRMVITDQIHNGLSDLFQDRKHLVLYQSDKELIDLVDHYLAKADERERIASEARKCVCALHTYEKRAAFVFDKLSEAKIAKAYWRKSSSGDISVSRAKLYAHWQQHDAFFKECFKPCGLYGRIVKSLFLLGWSFSAVLAGLKKIVRRCYG